VAAVLAAADKYRRDRCPQLAAAVSYHLLFSLVPLFIFVASALGVVLRDEEVRADFVDAVLDRFPLTPEAGVDIDRILASVPAPAGLAGLAGLVALLWSASSMTGSLRIALTAAFSEGPDRPFFQSKLVDLALVLAVAMLLLASFGLSVVVHAVQRWSARVSDELGALDLHEWSLLGNVGPALLAFVAFATLYRLVPPTRPKLRDVWVGALLAAVGFAAINIGFSYYLTSVATWDVLYGSLGSLLAFLLVVYLEVAVFLFGAELAAVWARPPPPGEEPGGPLHRRLLGALRGLFVRG
jgi:membrane protein